MPPSKCHCCLCRQKKKHTLLLLHSSLFSCICMQQHYCTCALTYSTAEPQKAPIIPPAHVFEEVEVSQRNVKQDLLGLSLGLRQFSLLLTLFRNWECGNTCHLDHKDFSNVAYRVTLVNLAPFYRKRQQTESLSVEYHHRCFEHSLVTGHYVH